MKQILILLFSLTFLQVSHASNMPLQIRGLKSATSEVATDIRVPEKQSVKVGPRTVLIETGNGNLIPNAGFEAETLTGWNTYLDTAGVAPLDGTGGTANITAIASASSPLRGAKSLLITKGAFNRQGEGVSTDFTIDPTDKTKMIKISFDYETNSYTSGDIRIYVYDVTNSKVIELVDRDLAANTQGSYTSFFQASPDSVNYRLIFHISSINDTAYTVKVDNVRVEPKGSVVKGVVVTDWQSYTPTFVAMGTPTQVNLKYRRNGSDLEIAGGWLTGTVTGSAATFTIPSGLTPSLSGHGVVGIYGTQGAANSAYPLIYFTTQPGIISFGSSNWQVQQTGTNIGTSSYVSVKLSIPIAGWSSNMVLSEDSGNREVRVYAQGNGGGGVTLNVTNISFTKVIDKTNSWNGSEFTAPEAGQYDIDGMVLYTTNTTGRMIGLAVDTGSGYTIPKLLSTRNATNEDIVKFQGTIYLEKGHKIAIRETNVSGTLANNPLHNLTIAKRSTPQTIALDHAKIEKCTDTYECTDTFSAEISSTGTVSNENLNWINGNCSLASATFTCPLVTGVFGSKPNCQITNLSGNTENRIESESTSSIGITTFNSGGSGVANAFKLSCSRGADYIGKTAKAVASDQNVRSIGSIGVDIQSVTFGAGADCSSVCTGTCTICRQVGTKITSVVHSGTTAIYYLNGIDGTKYSCSGNGVNAGFASGHPRGDLATTTRAVVRFGFNTSADNVAHAKVDCIGVP